MKYFLKYFVCERSKTVQRFMANVVLAVCAGNVYATANTVDIVKTPAGFQLSVNKDPFVVKGVGLGFQNGERVRALKQAGGNSFRTWSTRNIEKELALAEELGLMVAVGIETGKELQGFDYNNQAEVDKQFERVAAIVETYKDHPNVLCWVIANEPNLLFNDKGGLADVNPKVYKALGEIIDHIHKVDPNHPVTFTFAGANKSHIDTALTYAPNIDFISVQLYGDLGDLSEIIETLNINKPFMVTEFGPKGHWETEVTSWGREIEEPSAIKAAGMAERMQKAIINDTTGKVIGSYAFLWGQKQERTPTWYGMFNPGGERTARVDELTRIWTGSYPKNRAPLSYPITVNNLAPSANVHLKPSTKAKAKVVVSDPDGDKLEYQWYFMKEVTIRSQGGHHEEEPETLPVNVLSAKAGEDYIEIEFAAPSEAGEYRLFSYSYDGNNNVANANFPFMVVK